MLRLDLYSCLEPNIMPHHSTIGCMFRREGRFLVSLLLQYKAHG